MGATTQSIASQAGIDKVHPELLPEDKVKKVEELVGRYGAVAMVGHRGRYWCIPLGRR